MARYHQHVGGTRGEDNCPPASNLHVEDPCAIHPDGPAPAEREDATIRCGSVDDPAVVHLDRGTDMYPEDCTKKLGTCVCDPAAVEHPHDAARDRHRASVQGRRVPDHAPLCDSEAAALYPDCAALAPCRRVLDPRAVGNGDGDSTGDEHRPAVRGGVRVDNGAAVCECHVCTTAEPHGTSRVGRVS
eukprot:7387736-Prymnesium_polylepis.1